ncbi:hypothetical protein OG264_31125 [Streptomyces xanthophaeus]|uniref:hypothetical protein n=1 Tax=Streptomyces xanthophaeus TaxID=67385 RepID=UPI003868DF32|nr:hypothetical protein OG264_31125 [Streptomyces xanthophaeus]WST59455.1 hypothetical protein OG605_07315 [Streptomyces xanthophaeus]
MNADRDVPSIWFRLPPGFQDIGPSDRPQLEGIAQVLGGPEALREVTRLMDAMDALPAHHVIHTSIGLHPDEPSGVATSLFSLTVRDSEHRNPRVAVAQSALAIARSSLWSNSSRQVVELASSLPCCLVAGLISPQDVEDELFQARVVTADPMGGHVIVLDLTSRAREHADAYTSILEAVAHTLSFSDPTASTPSSGGTSRILEVLL